MYSNAVHRFFADHFWSTLAHYLFSKHALEPTVSCLFPLQDGEHLFGAKALSRYALLHRDKCWEELEWAGSHPQAPGMVATKPHYFAELDVVGESTSMITSKQPEMA